MCSLNRILFTLGSTAMLTLLNLPVEAQLESTVVPRATPEQPSIAQNQDATLLTSPNQDQLSASAILDSIINPALQDYPPGGSRGDLCLISPIAERNGIWNDRPIFIWKISALNKTSADNLQITIRNFQTQEMVWNQTVDLAQGYLVYGGERLQPGQSYSVELSNQADDLPLWIIEPTLRDQITAKLQTIATQFQASGAGAEEITIRQAGYLIEQGLHSDAFQLLYSLENPAPQVTQLINEIMSSACFD